MIKLWTHQLHSYCLINIFLKSWSDWKMVQTAYLRLKIRVWAWTEWWKTFGYFNVCKARRASGRHGNSLFFTIQCKLKIWTSILIFIFHIINYLTFKFRGCLIFGIKFHLKEILKQPGGAISFSGAEPFEQIVKTISTRGPMWNLVKIVQAVSEKKCKKIHNNIHVYSPRARTDSPQGTNLDLN